MPDVEAIVLHERPRPPIPVPRSGALLQRLITCRSQSLQPNDDTTSPNKIAGAIPDFLIGKAEDAACWVPFDEVVAVGWA